MKPSHSILFVCLLRIASPAISQATPPPAAQPPTPLVRDQESLQSATLRDLGGRVRFGAALGGLPIIYLYTIDGREPDAFGLKNRDCVPKRFTSRGQPRYKCFGEGYTVRLPPGRHILLVTCSATQPGGQATLYSSDPMSITFKAETARTYVPECNVDWVAHSWTPYVVDATDPSHATIVGGEKINQDPNGNDLIGAASNNDLSHVRALLDTKTNVDARSDSGETALIAAAGKGNVEVVHALLEANADVNAIDNHGMTGLQWASWAGETEVVRVLLSAKADVNAIDNHGMTALIFASQAGRTDAVRLLIGANADVNARNRSGESALEHACWQGHADVVQLLLEAKAHLSDKDARGWTPLKIALANHHVDVVELLKRAGAR